MASNNNTKTVVVADLQTISEIENTGSSFNGTANTILERYFEILKVGRREVRKTFNDNELILLADICNGTMFEPFGMILENNGILMQYEDTKDIYGEQFNEKWQVEDLTDKLSNLSKLAQIALIDVIEKFWNTAPEQIGDLFKR